MSRITKELAKNIATSLVKEKRLIQQELENKFKKRLEEEVFKTIPAEVKTLFATHKNWVKRSCTVDISGNGWQYDRYYINNDIPCTGSNTQAQFDEKVSNELMQMKNAYVDMDKEVKDLKNALETTLFNLRTFKQVSEHLPEAIPFLPKQGSMSTALTIDLTQLRERIK